jgi:hypothetical protein
MKDGKSSKHMGESDVGWNPNWPIFHELEGDPAKNTKNTGRNHKRNTQEQVQSHIH